jgi:precorrin-8X/cobalt-precorrin-8 methylmutase
MKRFDYQRDPAEIYRQSFATLEAEANVSAFAEDLRPVIIRMIHACGLVQLSKEAVGSDHFKSVAQAALASGATVLADCEMVKSGVMQKRMTQNNPLVCTLNNPAVPAMAKALKTTRSAAAVDLWQPYLEGSIVLIGNAPTALFALLEKLYAGAAKPAAIIGIPVGFVGAAESKQALIDSYSDLHIPFITVSGRMGGSAIAASALNAVILS